MLSDILGSPEGLEIREVETLPLVFRVRKIESRARFPMINVPFAVVVPGHAVAKLLFKVDSELRNRATQEMDCTFRFASAFKRIENASADVSRQPSVRVGAVSFASRRSDFSAIFDNVDFLIRTRFGNALFAVPQVVASIVFALQLWIRSQAFKVI